MEEIKVGEYVRTNNGIFIISHINIDFDDSDYKKICLCQNKKVAFTSIYYLNNLKHSPNIIDLIEVGDYINGSKLNSIDYAEDEFGNCDKLHFYYHFEDDEKDVNEYYDKLIIKSIVTKEQFEGIEYRLEE